METVDYAVFSAGFHGKMIAHRIPLTGTIEVTRRCPLQCLHCYNNLPMNDSEARSTELSYEEHCRILDEITDAGCLWLLYTGGEIFARRDFLDIYLYAKRKGLLITLFTNGTLITPRIADCLMEWRPFSIEVTLYGRTRDTYERLTGIPGSYDKCMHGIELLLKRRLPLSLKTVVVTTNRHEVWDMKEFARELGVEFKFDNMLNPRIDCSQRPLAVRLGPEEIVQLDLLDPARIDSWLKFAKRFNGPVHKAEDMDQIYHCGAGIDSFSIDPQGKMSLCVLSLFDRHDLRKGSFKEGWEGFIYKMRYKKMTRMTKCVPCEIKAMCGMCPANAELEAGDPESPVDFLCHVAHLRALAFDMAVPPHGECEYCESGAKRKALLRSLASLRKDSSLPLTISEGNSNILPIWSGEASVSAGCAAGGCIACGTAFIHQGEAEPSGADDSASGLKVANP